MRRSGGLHPIAVALGMFIVCLLVGAGAREAVGLVRWSSSASDERGLMVAVRSGRGGMRLKNLTSTAWAGCVVTIEGGVSSAPFAFPANGVMRLGFHSFRTGSTPLGEENDGFARAFHDTSMMCRDGNGRWQAATIR